MTRRFVLLTAALAAVAAVAYWMLPSSSAPAQSTAARSARTAARDVAPSLETPTAPVQPPKMVMTESGLRPQTTRRTPRTWVDPRNGAINREILDAVPDPEGIAAEELKYRKSRLRLMLSDAAAPCWTGGDAKEEIEFEYILVVDHEQIRAEDVRVKTSNIANPAVERCITDAVRDLKSPADKIPDTREQQGLVMSLHDLYDRNERAAKNAK